MIFLHIIPVRIIVSCLYKSTVDTQKITTLIFFCNFGIVHATQTFFLSFYQLTKFTAFTPAVMTKSLLAQSILGLILVLRIVSLSLTVFLGSMSKGFKKLKSGNSVSDLKLSEEVLELLSAIL